MARAMFIDTARYRWFLAIVVASGLLMLGAILLGFLGPQARSHLVDYSYDCPSGGHTWSPLCRGVQLGEPNETYQFALPRLEPMNGFWSVAVFPYNLDYLTMTINKAIIVNVNIFKRSSDTEEWSVLKANQTETEILLCDQGAPLCWGFTVVYEDTIRYPYYLMELSFPDGQGDNDQIKPSIGEVAFEYEWYAEPYIEMEMSMRMMFLVIATCSILLFWLRMRRIAFYEWTLEQMSVIVLLLSLIALNNPLSPFEYLVPGGFFPTVDCFLQVIHLCTLLTYWLFLFDYMRRGSKGPFFVRMDGFKVATVAVYGLLTFALFTWFRIADLADPVFGNTSSIFGLVVLFFCDLVLYGAIVVWIVFLMALCVPVVRQEQHLTARFMMAGVPGAVVIISLICGFFFGVFGPVQRTAPSFVYFFTLYNLYVLILLIGYWPANSTFGMLGNPQESTPIFNSTFTQFKEKEENVDVLSIDDL